MEKLPGNPSLPPGVTMRDLDGGMRETVCAKCGDSLWWPTCLEDARPVCDECLMAEFKEGAD